MGAVRKPKSLVLSRFVHWGSAWVFSLGCRPRGLGVRRGYVISDARERKALHPSGKRFDIGCTTREATEVEGSLPRLIPPLRGRRAVEAYIPTIPEEYKMEGCRPGSYQSRTTIPCPVLICTHPQGSHK